jgi:hypothetical protein
MRWLRIAALILLGALGLLAYWLLYLPDVRGLRFEAAHISDGKEPAQAPEVEHDLRPNGPMLELWFSSPNPLEAYIELTGTMPWVDVSFCKRPEVNPLQLLQTEGRLHPSERPDGKGRLHYRLLVSLATDRGFGDSPPPTRRFIAYDLRRDPSDLCVQLGGGNMLGLGYRSNTIRIPAATIRAALDRAGQ